MKQLLFLLPVLGFPSQVEAWTMTRCRFSRGYSCSRRGTFLALHHQQACYDSHHSSGSANGDSLELTAEQAQELVRAINEFNDQVQYYYEAKLRELHNILDQIKELNRLQVEYHEQLEREACQIQSTSDKLGHVMPTGPASASVDARVRDSREEAKEKLKLKVQLPAKYYQKITPAIRPSPAPGMPNVLTAQIESMLPTVKQSQPILAAEFEAYIVTTIQQIKLAQPVLAAELQSALTQTQQNQALLAAELSQLLVDAKQMVSTYVGDLSCLDGIDASGCDIF